VKRGCVTGHPASIMDAEMSLGYGVGIHYGRVFLSR